MHTGITFIIVRYGVFSALVYIVLYVCGTSSNAKDILCHLDIILGFVNNAKVFYLNVDILLPKQSFSEQNNVFRIISYYF